MSNEQRDELMKRLAADPAFVKSAETGTAYVIAWGPQGPWRKTWYIVGEMDGVKFARASRTDIRTIRRGESFCGVAYDELVVGMQLTDPKT